jgi:hypothetical protein
MFWGAISFLIVVLYVTLFIVLGLSTFAKGHYVLFWVGFIFPVLWIVGALLPPTQKVVARLS